MYEVNPIVTPHETACGPACLKMLLDFYGQAVELEQLIEECHVGVAGCSGRTLLEVGRAHGLDMHAWDMDVESILTIDRPAIIWWRFGHFVIYCGLNDKDEPVICNPVSGRFPISRSVFAQAFSGKVFCHGTPEDYVPKADDNYTEDQVFRYRTDLWIALRTITRGEKLVNGWNCKPYSIAEWINDHKEE